MINHLLYLFLILLPVHLANGSPVIFGMIPFLGFLKKPVDNGRTFLGKRIFGDHKTWLGILAGVITGLLFGTILSLIPQFPHLPDYVIFSSIAGLFAIFGDMLKSFLKRRIGITPGKPWIPFDQIDYLVFSLPLAAIFYRLSPTDIMIIIVQGFLLSITVSYVSYLAGIKEKFF